LHDFVEKIAIGELANEVGEVEILEDFAGIVPQLWLRGGTKVFLLRQSAGLDDFHAFRFGEAALVFIEGEEALATEVQRGGDMKDIGKAMPVLRSMGGAEAFGGLMHVGPVNRGRNEEFTGYIPLEIAQHPGSLWLGKTLGLVVPMKSHLEANGLAEFEEH
jgi:hypothetical protein